MICFKVKLPNLIMEHFTDAASFGGLELKLFLFAHKLGMIICLLMRFLFEFSVLAERKCYT